MDRDVYIAACRLAADMGEYITIGGGEPTLHPLLFDFIGIAQRHLSGIDSDAKPFIITNGKLSEEALALAQMDTCGFVSSQLSRDSFHEEIDSRVVRAFGKRIRDITRGGSVEPFPSGRARKYLRDSRADTSFQGCTCNDIFIDVHGVIYRCGCRRKQDVIDTVEHAARYGIQESIVEYASEHGWCIRDHRMHVSRKE